MKKEMNIENLIRNRKATKVALIVILVVTLAMATGCGKKKNKTPAPTTPSTTVTKEETTPEVVEPTESTPVETVEPTETVEEVNLVEEIDCNKYMVMSEWIEDANYDEPKITVWERENGTAYMLSDGAKYEILGNGYLYLYIPGGVNNIKDISSNVYIEESDICYTIPLNYLNLGEENEITCNITYKDDTQDTITVYITWNE